MQHLPLTIVQPHLEVGGAERQSLWLLNRLASEEGADLELLAFARKGALLDHIAQDVRIVDLGRESHIAIGVVAWRLRNALREREKRIILVRLWSAIFAVSLALMGSDNSRRRIIFYEDLDPTDHTRYIRFGRAKRVLIGWAYRTHELRHGIVVANTLHVAASMQRLYRLQRTPNYIHPTVTIPAASLRSEPAWQYSVTHFLTVGSLIERKGVHLILAALKRVRQPFVWTIVGDGPLRDELAKECESLRPNKVVFVGQTTNPYPLMESADALVHFPLSEAFGIVVAEAAACGLPVLASDTAGPREQATMTDAITLVPVGDIEALTRTLESFISCGVRRERTVMVQTDPVGPWLTLFEGLST